MTTMEDFRKMAAAMDQHVRQLSASGVKGGELLHRMIGHLPDLQRIWVGTNDRQLATLCNNYPGFYQYASLMEEAAERDRANPGRSRYKDLPQLEEPLKSKLAELLTDAATLELRYQALISGGTRKVDPRIEKLNRLHRKWLSNRERFIEALKEADLPQSVSEFAVPNLEQIADRISNLEKRVSIPHEDRQEPQLRRPQALPALTLNQYFMRDFVDAEAPCFALGLLEEHGKTYGLLAVRPEHDIPPEVTAAGFCFGHYLHSFRDFELIQFVFEFYGHQSYTVLVNPNNPIVQRVLGTMIADNDYFFFAMNPSGEVTTFRSELGEANQTGLATYLPVIKKSKTTYVQYRKALASFAKKPDPQGTLLNWVCRDDEDYLDLSEYRLELTLEEA